MNQGKCARIVTLGCRLNHADTALLTARLEKAGYHLCNDSRTPVDLIVVNTCAVTAEAEAKSRRQILRLHRENPGVPIIAAGCAVEVDPQALLNAGAVSVLTNPDKKGDIFKSSSGLKSREIKVENFCEKSFSSFPFRSRAFIKVQEGCDNFCSYCIVPVVRGASRSRDLKETLADCRKNIEAGFPEIVLTGVNTCNYNDSNCDLAGLISKISEIPGDFRIRLSSTEPHPGDLTLPELISTNPKVCRFLHLSMQHGSDRILKLMNRRYGAAEFAEFAANIKKLVPDIHLGTDFIVGFPGETDNDFAEALQIVRKIGFANIHCFAYSPRPGTAAAKMADRVHPNAVKERMSELRKIAAASAAGFIRSQFGKTAPVIFERVSAGIAHGWSDHYLAVTAPAESVTPGKIVNVVLSEENINTAVELP